jgi:hypothetical protein
MNNDDSTEDDLAFLRRMANAERVEPRDIDQLVEEIGGVLQRCRVDESNISDEERKLNEEMTLCVNHLFDAIFDRCETNDASAGAVALLLQKRISTPTNLEALLRMMDADVRTGIVRCRSSILIMILTSMGFVWGLKMNDGSYFTSCLVSCCSKSLDDEANQSKQIPHEAGCHCGNAGRMLVMALQTLKEDPLKVLDRVTPFDWKKILETYPYAELPDKCVRYRIFSILWDKSLAVLVLDRSNSKAKSFLRKLGSCHELFRSCLRRLVAIRSLPSSPEDTLAFLHNLRPLSRFLSNFLSCLVPPPSDPETGVLVSLANHSLKEVRPTVLAAIQFHKELAINHISIIPYDSMMVYTQADSWIRVKHLSDDDRWRRLETAFLAGQQAGDLKKTLKTHRQNTRKSMKSHSEAHLGIDEMCTNCLRLESGLEEGKKLMKCSWCKQVSYCSRECQKEHWKKFHKKECTGTKGKSNNK